MELKLTNIAIADLFAQSLVMIKEKAFKHKLTLSLEIEEGLTEFRGDKMKIKQILYNLLSNAVKFTPDCGSIVIKVGKSALGMTKTPSQQAGVHDKSYCNWIKIQLQDSGHGIKAEDLKRIFLSFEQADGTLSRNYQGTGLGLALTRNLVELHLGKIWAESPGPGQGATFHVILPIV